MSVQFRSATYFMEDIRLDEGAVLKTVASRRVRVRVPGLPLGLDSPVA